MLVNDNASKIVADGLHQTIKEKRNVSYIAVAFATVDYILQHISKIDNSDVRIKIKSIVDDIGEIAIIDRVFLEKNILAIFLYKTTDKNLLNKYNEPTAKYVIADYNNLYDILGISKYLAPTDIDDISKEISVFKTTYGAALTMFDNIAKGS